MTLARVDALGSGQATYLQLLDPLPSGDVLRISAHAILDLEARRDRVRNRENLTGPSAVAQRRVYDRGRTDGRNEHGPVILANGS